MDLDKISYTLDKRWTLKREEKLNQLSRAMKVFLESWIRINWDT